MERIRKCVILAAIVAAVFLIGSLVLPPAFRPETGDVTLPQAHTGERVACIEENTEALLWRLRMIREAEEEVIVSTFGFGTGQSGQDMAAALLAAAERGVEVKLLLDGFHGPKALSRSAELKALVTAEGVEVRIYNPLDPTAPWTANYRMHDKYLIVDGGMYLLGGRNTNDLFLGDYSDDPSLDRDIFVLGSGSAAELTAYFQSVWAQCEGYGYGDTEGVEQTRQRLRQRYGALLPSIPDGDWTAVTWAAEGVRLLSGSVEPRSKAPTVWKQMCVAMSQGQQIQIQTPYVICGREMREDLTALTDQGASVTVLTNSPATGANPFGCAELALRRQTLLDTGASLLEYAGERSLHGKTVLIDDTVSMVGSFNLDMRSAYLDTETMLWIDCPELNAHLRWELEGMARQSLHTAPDGTQTRGADYEDPDPGFWERLAVLLLGIVQTPVRHLL